MSARHISNHAILRYQERVEALPMEQVRERLSSPVILKAIHLGRCFVRLATGQRIVIDDGMIVTVLPADHYRRHIKRMGLGRYGHTDKAHRRGYSGGASE